MEGYNGFESKEEYLKYIKGIFSSKKSSNRHIYRDKK